jgi:hypothetical protein
VFYLGLAYPSGADALGVFLHRDDTIGWLMARKWKVKVGNCYRSNPMAKVTCLNSRCKCLAFVYAQGLGQPSIARKENNSHALRVSPSTC